MGKVTVLQTNECLVLGIDGEFTFDLNRDFRDAYKTSPGKTRYTVDLGKTRYMDSAGLGMLVQLREFAGGSGGQVTIKGAHGATRKILEVANFGKLFKLDD